MKSVGRTWSLIALEADARQYRGNNGYDDDLTTTYRYDSAVANHKQIATGDLIFLRNADHLLGVAQVEKIETSAVSKARQRCPQCGQVSLKFRKTRSLPWRCSGGHEFSSPASESVQLTGYEAHYGKSYLATPKAISVSQIKAAALRPNDQLSIEELDLAKLEAGLTEKFPETRALIASFLLGRNLDPVDAFVTTHIAHNDQQFVPSMSDTRETLLRAIKVRRGQKSFRDSLIRRYGARCVASGCKLMDIVEAAHIDPYRDFNHNHPENGLLLRADLHTLFDLNLMAVDPARLVLRFHPKALSAGYASLDGQPLQINETRRPSLLPIAKRWQVFLQQMSGS
ncbi:HNH endonuclease [Paraburkholderia caribensis]|uniref:HNH endonuclease n=1 Tax=Paraburkholderia caribensis TaxID=75105 RepID=UPI0015925CB7|nr:HNH endonuclease signature motif containing protein [Paraburkholderia caribensis]